jgi:hypothetical protein
MSNFIARTLITRGGAGLVRIGKTAAAPLGRRFADELDHVTYEMGLVGVTRVRRNGCPALRCARERTMEPQNAEEAFRREPEGFLRARMKCPHRHPGRARGFSDGLRVAERTRPSWRRDRTCADRSEDLTKRIVRSLPREPIEERPPPRTEGVVQRDGPIGECIRAIPRERRERSRSEANAERDITIRRIDVDERRAGADEARAHVARTVNGENEVRARIGHEPPRGEMGAVAAHERRFDDVREIGGRRRYAAPPKPRASLIEGNHLRAAFFLGALGGSFDFDASPNARASARCASGNQIITDRPKRPAKVLPFARAASGQPECPRRPRRDRRFPWHIRRQKRP